MAREKVKKTTKDGAVQSSPTEESGGVEVVVPTAKGIMSFFGKVSKEDAEKQCLERLKKAEVVPPTPARLQSDKTVGAKRAALQFNPGSTTGTFLVTKISDSVNVRQNSFRFPSRFDGALKRKQNVNLFVSGGKVVFQFNYNALVIDAIKSCLPGRQWDPAEKHWHCPMSSLEDAIALYEFMGRTADIEVKDRAKDIKMAYGGGAMSSSIKLTIKLSDLATQAANPTSGFQFGDVTLSFSFNSDVVDAFKIRLSPGLRRYDPASKEWVVDILALPELIEVLQTLDYTFPEPLVQISALCATLARSLSDGSLAYHENEVKETLTSPSCKDKEMVALYREITHLLYGQTNQLEDLSGDIGQAKKRKLSYQQLTWRDQQEEWRQQNDHFGEDWDSGCSSFLSSLRHMRMQPTFNRGGQPPPDCDCGRPHKMVGGRHVCRYFGTFECNSCSNRWTSAYTWKGETQQCRRCNTSNEPVQKDMLESGKGGGGQGAHDSSRCSQCRKLGYDCSY